ncbi:MAG: TldD/PmbA family protein, partial [Clostridia bacterium]|nr:TldD/PmbA family protein [Clostridia bacterium]
TAKKAGLATTGNAAGSGRVAPSNFYIAPGKDSLDALLETMGSGLLITELSGLHAGANPISGDFSLLARGFEVSGGKCVRAVEQFTVAGNFYQLLRDITAAADDLLFEGSPIGSPSVSVSSLNIAGE